jgi:hypothetical protein
VGTGFGGGTFNERVYLVDQGGDRIIILKLNVRLWDGEKYLIGLAQNKGQMTDTSECGNEHSGLIKNGAFLDQLRTGNMFK